MMQNTITMRRNKKIALVAHDNKKEELFEWAKLNRKLLAEHSLYATGATGQLLESIVILVNLDVIDTLRIVILPSVSAQAYYFRIVSRSYGVIPEPNGFTN